MIGRSWSTRKKVLIGAIIFIVITAGAVAGYLIYNQLQNNEAEVDETALQEAKQLASNFSKAQKSDAEIAEIVRTYGREYDGVMKELRETEVTEWTDDMIDKAVFALLYTDQIGARTQAQDLYYQLFAAQQMGKNVDANSAGVTQADREKILERSQVGQASEAGEASE